MGREESDIYTAFASGMHTIWGGVLLWVLALFLAVLGHNVEWFTDDGWGGFFAYGLLRSIYGISVMFISVLGAPLFFGTTSMWSVSISRRRIGCWISARGAARSSCRWPRTSAKGWVLTRIPR